jgi:hypothetical protein
LQDVREMIISAIPEAPGVFHDVYLRTREGDFTVEI